MIKSSAQSVVGKPRVDGTLPGPTAAIPPWAHDRDHKTDAPATLPVVCADSVHGCCPGAWLTVAQAAAQLQLSEKTVRRLIRKGELPAVAFGRSLRLRPPLLPTKSSAA